MNLITFCKFALKFCRNVTISVLFQRLAMLSRLVVACRTGTYRSAKRWSCAEKTVGHLVALGALAALCASCGNNRDSTSIPCQASGVAVCISPTSANMANHVNGSSIQQSFEAAVANAADQSVIWQVNGVTGGDGIHGTIDSNGNYTPPGVVPSDPIVVKAVANADNTKSATATVKVSYGRPAVNAAWQVTAPFGGSSVYALRSDAGNPNIVYALSPGALWVGTIGQAGSVQWTGLLNYPSYAVPYSPFYPAADLWANGKTIYATDSGDHGNGNFYRTQDGANWTNTQVCPAGAGIGYGSTVLAADPTGNIFLGTGCGAFKSTDGGSTWSYVAPNVEQAPFVKVLIDPRQPGSNYVYLLSTEGLEYTQDGGQSWGQALYNGSGTGNRDILDIAIDAKSSTGLYILIWQNLVVTLYHGDPTNGFNAVSSGLDASAVRTDSSGLVYLHGYNHSVYLSSDGGQTFTPDDGGLPLPPTAPTLQGDILPLSNGGLLASVAGYGAYSAPQGRRKCHVVIPKHRNDGMERSGCGRFQEFSFLWRCRFWRTVPLFQRELEESVAVCCGITGGSGSAK
jgi:hypothetical protein